MKQFKNQFNVGGKPLLLKAFAQELKEIGYNEKIEAGHMELWALEINYDGISGKIYNTYSSQAKDNPDYTLPRDWEAAMKAAKEEKIAIPEYVECTKDYTNQFTKGRIYKVDVEATTAGQLCVENDDEEDSNGWKPENFIPSTKKAYDKQKQEDEKDLEITGRKPLLNNYTSSDNEYEELDVLFLGCQKFTQNTVEMLIEIMEYQDVEELTWESGAAGEEVTITKTQLKKLLKLWKS